jgi:acetyl esterase
MAWKQCVSVADKESLRFSNAPERSQGVLLLNTHHLVDPEIAPIIEVLGEIDINADSLPMIRSGFGAILPDAPPPLLEPVFHQANGRDGAPDVLLYVYTPPGKRPDRPAILHIHGGGMVIGSAAMSLTSMPPIALACDAVVVSVEYRLAPETPFPGPQEDCYAALEWMVGNAAKLGIDPHRIVTMGESAGGGLAAALAHMVRDRAEFALSGQILIYPMLDHRTGGPLCPWRNPTSGEFIWKPHNNQFGWESLRGDYTMDDDRKGWFSPAVASSLSGLPPAYISVGTLDLFIDENLDYARRLSAAGVAVELHTYPGAIHAFDMMHDAAVAKRSMAHLWDALARML